MDTNKNVRVAFTPTAAPPLDVCPNIDGAQPAVPAGLVLDNGGNCVAAAPPDVCPNIDGAQPAVPAGLVLDNGRNCVAATAPDVSVTAPDASRAVPDVCPNIAGAQPAIPAGLVQDSGANCIAPATDRCPNIDGAQAAIPSGLQLDAAGNCIAPPPPPLDVCPNLGGAQQTIPRGMILEAAGKCVSQPEKLVTLIVNKSGKGEIKSSPRGIACGAVCTARFRRGTPVTLTASAAPGYVIGHWSRACSKTPCRITLNSDRSVVAGFSAKQGTKTVTLTVSQLAIIGDYAESSFVGHLIAAGAISTPATLTVGIKPTGAAERVQAQTFRMHVPAGQFKRTFKLPPAVWPGVYQLSISGVGRDASAPQQVRGVKVAAPQEGVVARAWVAAVRNGPPVSALPGAQTQLWAYFRFAPQGLPHRSLVVTWFAPDGARYSVGKPPGALEESFVRRATGLPHGTWKCVLSSGGKPLKTVTVAVR